MAEHSSSSSSVPKDKNTLTPPTILDSPTDFRSLNIINTDATHLTVTSTASPSKPLLSLTNSILLSSKTQPSMSLRSCSSSSSNNDKQILGVIKRTQLHSYVFAIGDPDNNDNNNNQSKIKWETLEKKSTWKKNIFVFEYELGKERRLFTWEKEKGRSLKSVEDLVLRERGLGTSSNESEGKVLAVFRDSKEWKGSERGVIWLRKGSKGGSRGDDYKGTELKDEDWTERDLVVLLTALCVLVNLGGAKGRESGLWLTSLFSSSKDK